MASDNLILRFQRLVLELCSSTGAPDGLEGEAVGDVVLGQVEASDIALLAFRAGALACSTSLCSVNRPVVFLLQLGEINETAPHGFGDAIASVRGPSNAKR